MNNYYGGPLRYLCHCLDEIYNISEGYIESERTRAVLKSLVEEARYHGGIMESALEGAKDIKTLTEERSKLKKEVAALEKIADEWKEQTNQSEDTDS